MDDTIKIEKEAEEEIAEEKSVLKRFLAIIIAIVIAILIVSYVFVTYPIGTILGGKLESSPIRNNIIDLGKFSIAFENSTYNEIRNNYFSEQKTEFSLCLLGYEENSNKTVYHVTSLYKPDAYSQTFNEVVFKPCSEDTIILLHTHPYKSCLASEQDIITLNKTKKINPNVLMVVMCEPDRFSVYS